MMPNTSAFQWFRLREAEQIKGYMRYTNPSAPYFSKDRFWWSSDPIKYNKKDSFAQAQDIHKQWLFENDIITMRSRKNSKKEFKAVILFDNDYFEFMAVNCDDFSKVYASHWEAYKLIFYSYLFINKDLKNSLVSEGFLDD